MQRVYGAVRYLLWIVFGLLLSISNIEANIGDFDADGNSDILFKQNNGAYNIWFIDSTGKKGSAFIMGDRGWSVKGVGDFDGDGNSDILFKQNNGAYTIWFIDSTGKKGSAFIMGDRGWSVEQNGDYDGDGKTDILFKQNNGAYTIWFIDSTGKKGSAHLMRDRGWSVQPPVAEDALSAENFSMVLDVNESKVVGDWKKLSSTNDGTATATLQSQGSYGNFRINGDSIEYEKSVESNASDRAVLRISNSTESVDINVTIDALYWKEISGGYRHTAAIKSDGTLWCWGKNKYGQLGDGTTTNSALPVQESSKSTNWKSVSAGDSYTMAIKDDGTLWGWGYNGGGRLGDGTGAERHEPTQEKSASTNWKSVSAGGDHTVAIKEDGTLWAWGVNSSGQLGDGTNDERREPTQEKTLSTDWVLASAGYKHTVAIKDDGTLWAWGDNDEGQLGDGTREKKNEPTQESSASTDWRYVSAGKYHTIAIKSDGTLWAWGQNAYGQLGDGSTTRREVPTQESSKATNWEKAEAAYSSTIALKSDGSIWSWGDNTYGQLGDGTAQQRETPTREYSQSTEWEKISSTLYHVLAIKSDGTLWDWGENNEGQLGDGTVYNTIVPNQEITKATDWVAVSAGKAHTLAIKSDGTLWAWGWNYHGALGDGTGTTYYIPRQEKSGSTDWKSVAAGEHHSIGLKNDGSLWGWGLNDKGQVGDGTTNDRYEPVEENTTARRWVAISAGGKSSGAIKENGTLWAWGNNYAGQLGDGTTTTTSKPTQEDSEAGDWDIVSRGSNHMIAIKQNETLWSCGDNNRGQLGDGTTNSRDVLTEENTSAQDWVKVSGGDEHTVAIKSDGTLWAWGCNGNGRLGDNSTTERHTPTQESSNANDWESVAAGYRHTVAIKSDGTLWSWGDNGYGQLGDGTTDGKKVPTQESTKATDWKSVSAGEEFTVAIKQDGTLWAWGNNGHGQLGTMHVVPQKVGRK